MTHDNRADPRVTIAIPVYKRLRFLPQCLQSIAEQDYPEIELLVSDNGENGPELRELVAEHYPRPFTFRRNAVSEPAMSRHFNQLVECASGKYFVLLCDDDTIEPGFVSAMVTALEADSEVGVAIPHVQLMDEDGEPLATDDYAKVPYGRPELKEMPPPVMTGTDLVRGWVGGEYRFKTFITTMARTSEIAAAGGYPVMVTGDDDAVLLRLILGRKAAFCETAVFWNRAYVTSGGLEISPWELAADIKSWLELLDSDPWLQRYASEHPDTWREVRGLMRQKAWRTYRHRWKTMYRERLPTREWLRAGFALPYIPEYYAWLSRYLFRQGLTNTKRRLLGDRA